MSGNLERTKSMKRSEFIKLVQQVGNTHEQMLEIYAVQAARFPNNKEYRADAERYATYDRIARETSDKIINLIHGHLPEEF